MKRVVFAVLLLLPLAVVAEEPGVIVEEPPTRQIEVTNFPDPQNVVGAVTVENLPSVQSVDGEVAVSNLPIADDGGLLVSCPGTQPSYQFYGDIFGGSALLTESIPVLPLGDFEIEGTANVTLFWEVTEQIGSAGAYDAAVIIEGFFDGPPSIKVFETEVASFQHYPEYDCCVRDYGTCSGPRHAPISASNGSGHGTVSFRNTIGLPQVRFVIRIEYRQRNLCTDVSYPYYRGAVPTPIDVSVDSMSVFIR